MKKALKEKKIVEAPKASDHPAWITPELVSATVRVMAVASQRSASEQEVVDLILQFGQLLDAAGLSRMTGFEHDEEVHGLGESQQPGARA